MIITCTLEDLHEHTEDIPSSGPEKSKHPKQQVKGSGPSPIGQWIRYVDRI